MTQTVEVAQAFRGIARANRGTSWTVGSRPLARGRPGRFAAGIKCVLVAVALSLPWGTGPVEGHQQAENDDAHGEGSRRLRIGAPPHSRSCPGGGAPSMPRCRECGWTSVRTTLTGTPFSESAVPLASVRGCLAWPSRTMIWRAEKIIRKLDRLWTIFLQSIFL